MGATWYLIGTGALAAQGFDVTPKDLDVFVDPADADRVFAACSDAVLVPLADSTGWVCARFGRLFLDALVEVAVDAAASVDIPHARPWGRVGRERLQTIEWRGRALRVPDLELHLADEERRGRAHYVSQLRERLHS